MEAHRMASCHLGELQESFLKEVVQAEFQKFQNKSDRQGHSRHVQKQRAERSQAMPRDTPSSSTRAGPLATSQIR